MSRKLSNNILHIMNKKVRPRTLRELRKRGMKKVSVLDLSDLNAMIQEAVSRTLGDLGVSLPQRELKIQSDRVREEFFKLTRERDSLKEMNLRLKEQLDELGKNREILSQRVIVDQTRLEKAETREFKEETVPLPPERIENIKEALEELLTDIFKDSGVAPELVTKAAVATVGLIEEERRRAVAEARAAHEENVTQLKRRISKLVAKLDETENMLSSMEIGEVDEDGIPSIFKSVQGLKKETDFFEEKKVALEKIFNLNLELKKLIEEP
jgi:hypothetical protein